MTVDAASAGCCCGQAPGGIPCAAFLSCTPSSIQFSLNRVDTIVRRYPAGGQYADSDSFVAAGTLFRQSNGTYVGTLQCSYAKSNQFEALAGGIHFEDDTSPCANRWGCPNLDCCATALDAEETETAQFQIEMRLSCAEISPGVSGLSLIVIDDGVQVPLTRSRQQVFCPDPNAPNPDVQVVQEGKLAMWLNASGLPQLISAQTRCLPLPEIQALNYDTTTITTSVQDSDLTCFRTIPIPPYFDLVGSCQIQQPDGSFANTVCGDIVSTQRTARLVTLG